MHNQMSLCNCVTLNLVRHGTKKNPKQFMVKHQLSKQRCMDAQIHAWTLKKLNCAWTHATQLTA
jgi:hypothetical protein